MLRDVPYRPFASQNCSIAGALSVLGERWTLLVMREVLLGHRHFSEIRRRTGAAANILSDRLQTLVDHGLLERRGSEYVATPKGLDVNPVLVALMQWGDRHISKKPPRIARRRSDGKRVRAALVTEDGELVAPGDVETVLTRARAS